jgi:hypothetical protein
MRIEGSNRRLSLHWTPLAKGNFHRWSLRNQSGRKDPGGRNDLLASVCLPYCDRFVTNDYAQYEELAEIARMAGLECDVQMFDQFRRIELE